MSCTHREEAATPTNVVICNACHDAVEVESCPDDDTTCPYAVAITNGHVIVRAYEFSEYDWERPRYENPPGTDVTADRYVTEKQPRPTITPWESHKIFDLEDGDERIQGSPENP